MLKSNFSANKIPSPFANRQIRVTIILTTYLKNS